MEDVIFAGTAKRSQTGFCEVSIIIDNSASELPKDVYKRQDTSEVCPAAGTKKHSAFRAKNIHGKNSEKPFGLSIQIQEDIVASKLVILESPNKIKAVKGYLGKNYKVIASVGHVRDLPKSTLGKMCIRDRLYPAQKHRFSAHQETAEPMHFRTGMIPVSYTHLALRSRRRL